MSLEIAEPKLQNFFIFNSKFGQKEGHEHEKLLFYYPKTETIDIQVRNIGFAEAITRFTNSFNKTDDCESLHTEKMHQIFYRPEADIWMVMTVAVGWIRKQKHSTFVKDYNGESVHDEVLKAHMVAAYKNYTFQHLPFMKIIEMEGRRVLGEILYTFFDKYLSTNNLTVGGILRVWNGVSFLPLDKNLFLRVHSMLSLLQASFPNIVHTAILFRGNFAWCGFCIDDFQTLAHFVTDKLSESGVESNLLYNPQSSSSSSSSSYVNPSVNSRFIGEDPLFSHVVYLRDEKNEVKPHHLVIYVLSGVVVCMSFSSDEILSRALFDKVASSIEGRISQLASDIGEHLGKKSNSDNFRYLYHNRLNLASSVYGVNELPHEIMNTIVDMHCDLNRESRGELTVKTSYGYWIVGKSSNGRESYIILSHKNANLVEVTDEVNRLCGSQFCSIFMAD